MVKNGSFWDQNRTFFAYISTIMSQNRILVQKINFILPKSVQKCVYTIFDHFGTKECHFGLFWAQISINYLQKSYFCPKFQLGFTKFSFLHQKNVKTQSCSPFKSHFGSKKGHFWLFRCFLACFLWEGGPKKIFGG